MQTTETDIQNQPAPAQAVSPQLTPHQLYNHHLLHPNEPITDEDILNLKIDSGGVYKDHQLTGEEALTGFVPDEEANRDTAKDEHQFSKLR